MNFRGASREILSRSNMSMIALAAAMSFAAPAMAQFPGGAASNMLILGASARNSADSQQAGVAKTQEKKGPPTSLSTAAKITGGAVALALTPIGIIELVNGISLRSELRRRRQSGLTL